MEAYILELFQKLDKGTLRPFEKEILEEWISSNEEKTIDFAKTKDQDWTTLSKKLQPSKQKNRVIQIYKWSGIAASFIVVLAAIALLFPSNETVQVFCLKEVREVVLPDQSIVTLNEYSTITYDSGFGNSHRTIDLQGEAYFKVTKNKNLPFSIQTTNAKTQVLGTAFYLKESKEDSLIILDVDEGVVSIQAGTNPPIIKKKGQRYSYNKSTGSESNFMMSENDKYWKTQTLVFDNTPLQVAIKQISKAYDVEIAIESDISKCKLTSRFASEKLIDVLKVLAITYQGKSTVVSDKKYLLSNLNCK